MPAVALPIDPPADRRLLEGFLGFFKIDPNLPVRELVGALGRAFSGLPYENLTKIIKYAGVQTPERARRWPEEVLSDHYRLGSGGTCFSLTGALLHLVRSLGIVAEPVLADRPYGLETHCAMYLWLDGQKHLLDPGYLIVDPVPVPTTCAVRIDNGFTKVELVPEPTRMALYTFEREKKKLRLSFHFEPADPGAFMRAWDRSFSWEMMRYPLLTRVDGQSQLYLRGGHFQVRNLNQVQRESLHQDILAESIAAKFKIKPEVARRALEVLHAQGERFGAPK